jgi:hypothetical protein
VLSLFLFPKNVVPVVLVGFGYWLLTLAHTLLFGAASGLFSVLVEDSGLVSTILFSVIVFLGEVSLALSTDIVFPYRHMLFNGGSV